MPLREYLRTLANHIQTIADTALQRKGELNSILDRLKDEYVALAVRYIEQEIEDETYRADVKRIEDMVKRLEDETNKAETLANTYHEHAATARETAEQSDPGRVTAGAWKFVLDNSQSLHAGFSSRTVRWLDQFRSEEGRHLRDDATTDLSAIIQTCTTSLVHRLLAYKIVTTDLLTGFLE